MCLWLVIKHIEDIYKAITTSHNLPLTSIEKYLQISSNEFWLVVIPIQDIYKCIWDIFKKNQLEISNCILTSQIIFKDIVMNLVATHYISCTTL